MNSYVQKLTPKQRAFRKSLLTKIHLADGYVSFYADNEEDYRDMLQQSFGKRSAADLTINQLISLLDFLQGKRANPVERVTQAQLDFIHNGWMFKARDKSTRALMKFANRNTGLTLIRLEALTKQQATGIIHAINRMKKAWAMNLPNMKKPCKDCPFRKDCQQGWLGEDRIEEILQADTFVCHKKTDFQCAGHMLINGNKNTFVRLANNLNIDTGLSGKELIFNNHQDCISHHQ